jgi:stearoyl-CoA desaturase (delta-9 desaturase)
MSTLTSPTRPGAGTLRRQPAPSVHVPNWVKSIPFIALHVVCLAALFTGFSALSLTLLAATYLIKMFGITGGYHRYFAHRSYKTSRVMQFVLAWLGCSALQRGPLWWASHHRVHHRYSDTPKDPHSPHETSFWWAHLGWVMDEDTIEAPWETIQDFRRFPELRWLDQWHWVPGILLAVLCYVIGAVAGGWRGDLSSFFLQHEGWTCLVWGWLISTVLTYHATFSINSLSHLWGNRRYATDDDSRNNWFLALITLGEGWHNNHHHFQSSANQGFFWWEYDISYMVIRSMQLVGLVWDVRRPGAKALASRTIDPSRATATMDEAKIAG